MRTKTGKRVLKTTCRKHLSLDAPIRGFLPTAPAHALDAPLATHPVSMTLEPTAPPLAWCYDNGMIKLITDEGWVREGSNSQKKCWLKTVVQIHWPIALSSFANEIPWFICHIGSIQMTWKNGECCLLFAACIFFLHVNRTDSIANDLERSFSSWGVVKRWKKLWMGRTCWLYWRKVYQEKTFKKFSEWGWITGSW